jgi:head-tail adaptor
MELNLNLATDADHFDGLTPVTVRSSDQSAINTVSGALRRAVTQREAAAADGKYTESDVKWHLPAVQIATPPEPGATITDTAGNVWTVLAVERQSLDNRWRCWTRDLAVAAGLDQLITVEKAVWNKSPSGAPVAAWAPLRTSLRARIQPREGRIDVEHDRRLVRITHEVYLAEPIPLDANFRIVHEEVVYNVVSYQEPERIDRLPVVQVERVPWPLS